ncbi:60S ribosomal protein L18a-like protein [Quercus lobata]|uniref:60S ribosomal protein L18a-like protein n=1 Tax=Quercus lobata TaxID=97700 RepID=UPI001243BB38|nr:60S ribosomal protein L18a-like protein [Quercus lobata]
MSQEEKNKGVPVPAEHHHIQHQQNDPPPQYGTFQGVANYPPPLPPQHQHQHEPVIGLPQPAPPPGATYPSAPPPPPPQYYAQGYQAVPGYAIAEGRPVAVRERRLPCCGIGVGWCLFIIGFFLAAIPWYVGALILLCSRIDYREKPGLIACTVAAIIGTIVIILGATKGADDW